MVLLSFIRVITGADDLTSAGTVAAAIGLSRPHRDGRASAASGRSAPASSTSASRACSILGTFGAGWAGYQWGPWAGVFVGVTFGALGGLLHAVATVTFAVDQIVSGVAINILALGADAATSPRSSSRAWPVAARPSRRRWTRWARSRCPGVSSFLLDVADNGWFLISDIAAVLAGAHDEPVLPDRDRRPARGRDLLHAVAYGLRPAAAVLRRGAARGRHARREGEAPQVRSRGHVRRARRLRRGVPRRGAVEHLPRGPDRRDAATSASPR